MHGRIAVKPISRKEIKPKFFLSPLFAGATGA